MDDNSNVIVTITADNYFGARHALESLSQMWGHQEEATEKNGPAAARVTYIIIDSLLLDDGPEFKHRGVLIDTSRNYISKANIFQMHSFIILNCNNLP